MMVFPLIFFFLICLSPSTAIDNLSPGQTLLDNGQTIVSASQTFELGFFSLWNSENRYVGIWFKNVPQQTPVWVANKNSPLGDSSGVLVITSSGKILIANNATNTIIWSSNSSYSAATSNPVLQLLDNGNLVVKTNVLGDYYLWQSFDHPCDTLIPGMNLGWNLRNNQEWYLTSWKTLQDPSSGDYTYRVDPRGLLQLVLRQGAQVQYRSGPWDGVRFGGGPKFSKNAVYDPIFVFDSNNVFYSFVNNDNSIISRFVVNQSGALNHLTWNERRNEWIVIITLRTDMCDRYALCGPYGFCNADRLLVCQCPDGFTPRLPEDWARLDWSGGCVRKTPLNCSVAAGFRRFPRLKLPDTAYFLVNRTEMNLVECREACLRNCSCVAYARTEVSGCVAWLGDLLDVRDYSEGGQDLYVRMAASDLGKTFSNLLEIISRLICSSTGMLDQAWKVWNGGKPLELVDAVMESPVPTSEVLRCIQTGLLCVQQRPEDRPTMSSVLLMLDSENPMLPQPKQPGFYTERFLLHADSSSTGKKPFSSSNDVTVTMLQGR
ncbi:hypothetical protein RJ639_036594 [Escallonia herrerae]|uniref:Uncharacterized protein n=1 Tax=Escallonia herrerae TaxID=1293975 RepID=A0AA88WT05_9ASTE|nr:hypothetical protein RJ639_036594 [Escallonia herrerae]